MILHTFGVQVVAKSHEPVSTGACVVRWVGIEPSHNESLKLRFHVGVSKADDGAPNKTLL